MIYAFLYGILLAFGLIIPLGVQNIFVFNQGVLQRNITYALPSVITAFLCDVILIISAVLGISSVVLAIPFLKTVLFVSGIFFLVYMGWINWKQQEQVNEYHQPLSIRRQIIFSVSVSLLNPHAIMDTIGVIGTCSLKYSHYEKYAFTVGCLVISLIWFLFLSFTGSYIKKMDQTGVFIKKLNKLSSIIMWLMALYLTNQFISIQS